MGDRAVLRCLFCLSLLLPAAASALTATPTATPTGLGHLTVRVAEQPVTCSGGVQDASVTLQPLGLGGITGPEGLVKFNVPPGDYTLAVIPRCNDVACWPEQVVAVPAGTSAVTICPFAGTPTTVTPTPTATPEPTGSPLGEKTTVLRAFNLISGVPFAGAAVECSSPRVTRQGVTNVEGLFSCTLDLRDTDTILTVVGAPGFQERRRGYGGRDLSSNTDVLQFGLIPDGLCGGDCNGDHEVRIAELVHVVSLILSTGESDECALSDIDGDGRVAVNDAVLGVTYALGGCPIE